MCSKIQTVGKEGINIQSLKIKTSIRDFVASDFHCILIVLSSRTSVSLKNEITSNKKEN